MHPFFFKKTSDMLHKLLIILTLVAIVLSQTTEEDPCILKVKDKDGKEQIINIKQLANDK